MKTTVTSKSLTDLPNMIQQAEIAHKAGPSGSVNSFADMAIEVIRSVMNDTTGIDAMRSHGQANNCSKLVYMFDSELALDDTLSLIPIESFRVHVLIPEPVWSRDSVRDIFAARLGASVVGDNRLQIGGAGNVRQVWSTVRGDWRKRETRYTISCPSCRKNRTTKKKETVDPESGMPKTITIHPTVFMLGANHGTCRVCHTKMSWSSLVVGDNIRYGSEQRRSASDIHLCRGDRAVAIIDRMKYALTGQVRDDARAPITRAFAVPFRLYTTRRADATTMDSSMLDMLGFSRMITQWAKNGTTLLISRSSQQGIVSAVESTPAGLSISVQASTTHTIIVPKGFVPKVVVGQDVAFGDVLAEPPRLTADQLKTHPQRKEIAEALLTGFTRFEPAVQPKYSQESPEKVIGLTIDRTRACGSVYYPIEAVLPEHRGSIYVWYDRTIVRPATPIICTDKQCSCTGTESEAQSVMMKLLTGATEKVVYDFFSGILDNPELAASHAAESADKAAISEMLLNRRYAMMRATRAASKAAAQQQEAQQKMPENKSKSDCVDTTPAVVEPVASAVVEPVASAVVEPVAPAVV